MLMGERIVVVIAAIAAVLLQVFVAPHIAIGFAFPNFAVALCLAVALVRHDYSNPVLPFVLGLVFDLASGGPVGAMALALTLTTTFEAWFYDRARNDTMFMALAVLAVCVLLTELLYGMAFLMFGYASGFLEAFVYRMVPCFAYDFVLAAIVYAVASRFMGGEAVSRTEITQL